LVWRVRWTTPAWNDVEAASGFIARDSPRYAVILQREAQAAAKSLRHFPKRGRIIPERNDERLRELIVGSHRLLYKIIGDDEIVVIAFVHCARDLATFLENKDR
jgi:toxin ParE1/3/4